MNTSTTRFLQVLIVMAGLCTLALMLWEPQLEGRNAQATQFEIYFHDPFLAYAYGASIPVFVALWQAFTALEAIRQSGSFSASTIKALRVIRICALMVAGFVLGAEAWLFTVQRGEEDIAGGVAIGLFLILLSAAIAMGAALLERALKNRLGLTPQNSLNRA